MEQERRQFGERRRFARSSTLQQVARTAERQAGPPVGQGGHTQLDEMRRLFAASEQDFERVRKFGKLVVPKIDTFIEIFYVYLRNALGPDFEVHFPNEKALASAQAAARRGWLEFFEARWDVKYLESRERIGHVHAQLQIEPRHYLAAMNRAIEIWTESVYTGGAFDDKEWAAVLAALRRTASMEGALVVDVYARRTGEVISQQSRAMLDMSTPIAALWNGVLMLPIVGLLDSRRAEDVMQRMLEQIAEKRAEMFILDISGVAVVDTAVANHLIRMTKAAQLMGCDTIVSGLSPSVARTIVELGIDVGEMKTTGTLQDALKIAFKRVRLEQADGRG
jgi:rsbT co-antagonist protein RsbR